MVTVLQKVGAHSLGFFSKSGNHSACPICLEMGSDSAHTVVCVQQEEGQHTGWNASPKTWVPGMRGQGEDVTLQLVRFCLVSALSGCSYF